MKRIRAAFLLLALPIALGIFVNNWWVSNTADTVVTYGASTLYSQEDMNEAVRAIFDDYHKNWRGFTLHSITYPSDEESGSEALKEINDLYNKDYSELIVFTSSFRTAKDEYRSSGFPPNEEVDHWYWYLARKDHGDWEIITNGV